MDCEDKKIVIIGAGPAGLSASYELGKKGYSAICLESTSEVGGISRTIEYNGYLFDIGGHGFISSDLEVISLWNELLGEDLLESPQNVGLYFKNYFFAYPPKLKDAIKGFGLAESFYSFCSLTRSLVAPLSDTSNMENWWINQYGRHFYGHFFKNYNEKVWGLPSNQILSEMNNWRSKNPVLRLIKHAIKNQNADGHPTLNRLSDNYHR
jgi:protoporphyrinogen oxidase